MAYLDGELYEAAVKGNLDSVRKYDRDLKLLLTPKRNSILHIHLISPSKRSAPFVREVLSMCPELLLLANANGDTPMHIAARYGHLRIVALLLKLTERQNADEESGVEATAHMLQMQNMRKNTPLHEASRHNHPKVAKMLAEQNPDCLNLANDDEKTPLYLAAEKGNLYVVINLLLACTSEAYRGPYGRTALHAAVLSGNRGVVLEIVKKKKDLAVGVDEYGWTPLHYAAYGPEEFYRTRVIVQRLLEHDSSAAYIVDTERKRTPLHIAACRGNVRIMEEIILKCPDCCELTDSRGWNVLHYAVISKSDEALRLVTENPSFIDLINDRDVQGNAPLHLLAVSRPQMPHLVHDGEDDLNAFYEKNVGSRDNLIADLLQPMEMVMRWMEDLGTGPLGQIWIDRKGSWETQDLRKGPKEAKVIVKFEKSKNAFLVVSALVATVTFTAAFTLPGGYISDDRDSEQGTAILTKNRAFEAFVISNSIAMVLSTTSVFIHFIVMLLGHQEKYWWLIRATLTFIMVAMGAMVIAFAMGTYAILSPSLWLVVATCAICSFFFIYVIYMLCRLYKKPLGNAYLQVALKISKLTRTRSTNIVA